MRLAIPILLAALTLLSIPALLLAEPAPAAHATPAAAAETTQPADAAARCEGFPCGAVNLVCRPLFGRPCVA